MNFEGFQDLICRVAVNWLKFAKKGIQDIDPILKYLQKSPFNSSKTPENEAAYQSLMDVRLKLYELSYEIDNYHDSYMEFMHEVFDNPDLLDKVTSNLKMEEKHLVHLELMIMEQVEDWEIDTRKYDQESVWTKVKRMVVDCPDGKTVTIDISQPPQKRYWFGMCPVSSTLGNMKWCSGCKVVGYIGKEEQKEDWPKHKELCKSLTKLRQEKQHWLANFCRGDSFLAALKKELQRSLTQYETDIGNHPRVCMICDSYDQEKLVNCQKCYSVSFCPSHIDNGKLKHEPHCTLLRTDLDDYKFEITVGHQVQNYSPAILNSWTPLPREIEEFFSEDVSSIVSQKLPGYREFELRHLTFLYTCPLTVLAAMEEIGLGSRAIHEVDSLTIHLVGSRIAEIRHIPAWEVIASRLPKLKRMDIIFIGDECDKMKFPKQFNYKGKNLQTEKRKALKISYQFEPFTLYHDYIKKESFVEPDVVVALDCGFKFYPSWNKSIPSMARPGGAPLIFTEFNLQDSKDNLSLVKSLIDNVQVAIEPKRNLFSSKRPIRSSDFTGNYVPHSVIYTNDYVCAVKRK